MMKLWCDNCKAAVEPVVSREKEFHDEVDTRCYEEYDVYTCPICGEEVYLDPGECAMCGEPCSPDRDLCENCIDEIESAITPIVCKHGYQSTIDGIASYTGRE